MSSIPLLLPFFILSAVLYISSPVNGVIMAYEHNVYYLLEHRLERMGDRRHVRLRYILVYDKTYSMVSVIVAFCMK